MPTFNLAKDRTWSARPDTQGWERCGLFNDKRDPSEGFKSYTTLNRVAPGGTVQGYHVDWHWELFVVDGEVRVGDVPMRPGDHAIFSPGEQFSCESATGCTILTVGHLK